MKVKRIIPCLDIIKGRVTKGVRFKDNIDLGDPLEMARRYQDDGCDELVAYDIMASAEGRPIDFELMARIAAVVRVPLTAGGGIATLADMRRLVDLGVDKLSLNSLAVKEPGLIAAGAAALGRGALVLGMDPIATTERARCPSGYEITIRGFRERTGLDAVAWARRAVELGVGEIVVNSVDADGTRAGYDLELTGLIAAAVEVPVIASGGAGCGAHLREAFALEGVTGAIVAGILHSGSITIAQLRAQI